MEENYERALEQFDIVSRLSPSDGQVRALIAAIKRRQGHWPESLEAYEKAAKIEPAKPEHCAQRGLHEHGPAPLAGSIPRGGTDARNGARFSGGKRFKAAMWISGGKATCGC